MRGHPNRNSKTWNITTSLMKMYADDTKLYRPVSGLKDVQLLQDDLDVLTEVRKMVTEI